MKPLRLQLRNFMSHSLTDLDLSEVSLAAIVGENGAGKSTILQAITYCLWGQVRTSSHNDVVKRGKQECVVRLDFAIGDQQYQVTRRRDLGGQGTSSLEFAHCHGEDYVPLTQNKIRDTQEEIDKVLGMSYAVFSSSAFLQQGEAAKFSDARPGERKELLAEMLQLEWFQRLERLTRDKLKTVDSELSTYKAVMETVQQQLADLPLLDREDLDLLAYKADLVREEIRKNENQLSRLRTDLEDLRKLKAHMDKLAERKSAYHNRIDELDGQIEKLENEVEALSTWESKRDDILETLGAARKAVEKKKEFDPLAEQARNLQRQADSLDGLTEALAEKEKDIEAFRQYVAEAAAEVERCETEFFNLNKEREKLSRDLAQAQAAIGVLEAQYVEARERRDALETASTCPTCGQILADPESLLADLEQQLSDLERRVWEERRNEAEIRAEAIDLEEKARKARNESTGIAGRLKQAEKDLAQQEALANAISIDVEKCNRAEDELVQLAFDWKEYEQVCKDAEQSVEAESLHTRMQIGLDGLREAKKELDEAKTNLGKGNLALIDLQREIDSIEESIGEFEPEDWLTEEIDQLQPAVNDNRKRLETVEKEKAVAEEQRKQRTKLLAQYQEAESKIGLLAMKATNLQVLVKGTSKAGAQALVIEAAIPQIEKDANGFLEEMFPGTQVMLNTQRETLRGSASETLEIVVSKEGQDAPIESLSGGERFRVDLALRLAIGRMLARRSGRTIQMLAIDEGFGSQDDNGQAVIIEVLCSLTKFFDLVMVISHVRSVAEAIGASGHVLEVKKLGGKSVVEVK